MEFSSCLCSFSCLLGQHFSNSSLLRPLHERVVWTDSSAGSLLLLKVPGSVGCWGGLP